MKSIFTFCLFLIFSSPCLFAQTFTEVTTPFEGVRDGSISFADVNADNAPDVLITGRNISFARIAKLYLNDGQGNFTEEMGTPFEGVDKSSIAFADVNADNAPDVLITGQTASNLHIAKLYLNDGQGSFTEESGTPFEGVVGGSISFANVNADNAPDVMITGVNINSDPIAKLYLNDGQGSFTEVLGTPFEGVDKSSISFADVNADNAPDVMITGQNINFDPIAKLYLNDGQGSFTEVQGTPFDGVIDGSISFADVNADNAPDLLITGQKINTDRIAKLYLNDGQGSFTEVQGTPFEGVDRSSISFADVNADNTPDVLITGKTGSARIAKLYLNDGQGSFTEELGTPFEGMDASSIAFADVNADNAPDVLITGRNSSVIPMAKLYLNDGSTSTNEPNHSSGISYTLSPNPIVNGVLNIQVNTEQPSRVRINLFDVIGQQLHQQEEQLISGENKVLFDVSKLEKGTYFVEIENGEDRGVQKLIIL